MKSQSQNEIIVFWGGSENDIVIVGIWVNFLNTCKSEWQKEDIINKIKA